MRFVKSLAALLTSAAAIGLTAGWAAAQSDYPAHPIIMIVPFPAGGASDVIARIVGEHMSRTLGQPIIIENVGGAGGTIGSNSSDARQSRWVHHRVGQYGHARFLGRCLSESRLQA